MKKLFSILLLGISLLLITGCGQSSSSNNPKPVKVNYISNRTTQYDSITEKHTIFWGFTETEDGPLVKSDAEFLIIIKDKAQEILYEKTFNVSENNYSIWSRQGWESSRLLGSIVISNDDIIPGVSNEGTLEMSVTFPDGSYFSPYTMKIGNLPIKDLEVALPEFPVTTSRYILGNKYSSASIKEVTFEPSSIGYKMNIKAEMTYNKNGKKASDFIEFVYKIKDSEGVVLESRTMILGPMSVGEVIYESTYLNGISLGKQYSIEFSDAR